MNKTEVESVQLGKTYIADMDKYPPAQMLPRQMSWWHLLICCICSQGRVLSSFIFQGPFPKNNSNFFKFFSNFFKVFPIFSRFFPFFLVFFNSFPRFFKFFQKNFKIFPVAPTCCYNLGPITGPTNKLGRTLNSVNIWARKMFFFFLNKSEFCQKFIGYVIRELGRQKYI